MIARMQNKRGRPTQKLKDLKEKLKKLEEEEIPSKRTKKKIIFLFYLYSP